MQAGIQDKLRSLRDEYATEGFVISGVFGSMARGDENPDSDIDILYRLTREFHERYKGLDALMRIEEIRLELATGFGTAVDLADEDYLDEAGRRYITAERVLD
jgi:predicted nucleotidyltransferase